MGGSTKSLLHIPAIAHEVGIKISPEDFERISSSTPYLVKIKPSGRHTLKDLEKRRWDTGRNEGTGKPPKYFTLYG